MSSALQVPGAEVRGQWREGYEPVLTGESLGLLDRLQCEFGPRRTELVQGRADRDAELAAGALPEVTGGKCEKARELFEQVALADDFVDFLTLPAYERIG